MNMQWKEPPPAGTSRNADKYMEIADELRRNPGKWAMIGRMSAQNASNIKDGRLAAFRPRGTFEATYRNISKSEVGPDTADIYARYVGEEGNP